MTKLLVTADLDYVQGHLRYGHKELEVDKAEWEAMSEQDQIDYFHDESETIVDDYEIEDAGGLGELKVQEL